MKIKHLVFAVLFMVGGQMAAQNKLAHVDLEALVQSMPETQAAQASLEEYGKQLQKDLEDMYTEYQNRAQAFKTAEPNMTNLNKETKLKEIQELERRIEEYQQRMNVDFQTRQGELLKPIIEKVEQAINEVTIAEGINYVIDSSASKRTLLSINNGTDLTPVVKKKLGLN